MLVLVLVLMLMLLVMLLVVLVLLVVLSWINKLSHRRRPFDGVVGTYLGSEGGHWSAVRQY